MRGCKGWLRDGTCGGRCVALIPSAAAWPRPKKATRTIKRTTGCHILVVVVMPVLVLPLACGPWWCLCGLLGGVVAIVVCGDGGGAGGSN